MRVFFILLQVLNADSPIVFTELGIVIVVNLLHPLYLQIALYQ